MSGFKRPIVDIYDRSVRQGLSLVGSVLTGVVLLVVGCGDDALDPNEVLSVAVAPSDTLIFATDAVTFEVVVEYRSGPGGPDRIAWSVSDGTMLALSVEPDRRATVTGIERGEAFVIAEVDGQFVDSAQVTVVEPGDVRWRVEVTGWTNWPNAPALDGQGHIYVIAYEWLSAFEFDGIPVFCVPGPLSSMSPSVSVDGRAYVTGGPCADARYCTQRHNPDGTVDWSVPFSVGLDGGIAVGPGGFVAVLHREIDPCCSTVLSRVSSEGTEEWRTTLGSSYSSRYYTAPAIASNGDIYVAWRDSTSALQYYSSRISSDGTLRWTQPFSPGRRPYHVSPAIHEDRIAFSYNGGLAVYDTAGVMIWERTFSATWTSSPVIDDGGNTYLQTGDGLRSYDANGAPRWTADSLGAACGGGGSGGPSLLADGQLLVACRDNDTQGVCSVSSADGALNWRQRGLKVCASPAVAPDGTIYVVGLLDDRNELVALWNRVPPLTEGWPTEGGGMGRLRRQQ